MTAATATTAALAELQSAGLVLGLTPERGLMVTPASRLTPPLRELIKAHRDDLVRWLGKEASNDPATLSPATAPTEPLDWHALDKAYQAHHVTCPVCIAAGKVDGQRCGTGAALWAAYDQTPKPAPTRAQPAPAPAPPVPKPVAGIHPSLMTAATPDEIKRMVQRLALFAARGLSEGEADRLTDKLLVRDREVFDRRGVCAECVNLKGTGPGRWKCGDTRTTNDLAGAWVGAAFVHLRLHRCKGLIHRVQ
jgi:hypothetical protein